MTPPRAVRFYLYPDLLRRAEAGRAGIVTSMADVLAQHGFDIAFRPEGPDACWPGYTVHRMTDPLHTRGVTFRRTYIDPFWRIERHGRRWDWPVAKALFDPDQVKPERAAQFFCNWRRKLFGTAADAPRRDGFVYMPLQGRLLERRSFQTYSPVEMIERTLQHLPHLPIKAGLHPKETYTSAERARLTNIAERYAQFTLTDAPMVSLLHGCDLVVTQNSSVAFSGFFFEKPAVLFAGIDFHHIAANVAQMGAAEALRQGPDLQPDYKAYLFWFLQMQAISIARPNAENKIAEALLRAGWPLRLNT